MSSIEKDIKNIKQYINLVLDEGYCDCNELNMISTGRYCDGSKNVAYSMQNILAEREKDKKRIKELEEENKIYVLNGDNVKLELYIKENYIPVQKVKDKIEENNKIMIDTQNKYPGTYAMLDEWRNAKAQNDILEELLEDK